MLKLVRIMNHGIRDDSLISTITVPEAFRGLKKLCHKAVIGLYKNRFRVLDAIPFFLIILVLIISPLPYASTPYWAISISLILIFTAMIFWCTNVIASAAKQSSFHLNCHPEQREGSCTIATSPLLYALLAITLLALFQLIPLPITIYNYLSPYRYELLSQLLPEGTHWYPLSLSPFLTYKEFFKLLGYTFFYFLLLNTVKTPKRFKILICTVITMGFFEAIYGLTEYLGGTHRILFWKNIYGGIGPSGTFINKNHYAAYLNLCFWITAGFVLDRKTRVQSDTETWRENFLYLFSEHSFKASILMFIPAVMVISVYLSQSRGGVSSLCIGTWIFIAILLIKKGVHSRSLLAILGISASACIVFYLIPDWTLNISRYFTSLGEMIANESERFNYWNDTLNLSNHFLFLGSGLGTFVHVFPQFQTLLVGGPFGTDLLIDHTHNDYLEFLSEMGIISLLTITIFTAHLFIRAMRKSTHNITFAALAAVLAFSIHSLVEFNFRIPANAFLFLFVLYSAGVKTYKNKEFNHGGKMGILLCVGLTCISLYGLFSVYNLGKADANLREMEQELKEGKITEAGTLLETVTRLTPKDARVWLYHDLLAKHTKTKAKSSSTNLDQQRIHFLNKAIVMNPTNAYFHAELGLIHVARVEKERGEGNLRGAEMASQEADTYLRNAQKLSPTRHAIIEACRKIRNRLLKPPQS